MCTSRQDTISRGEKTESKVEISNKTHVVGGAGGTAWRRATPELTLGLQVVRLEVFSRLEETSTVYFDNPSVKTVSSLRASHSLEDLFLLWFSMISAFYY